MKKKKNDVRKKKIVADSVDFVKLSNGQMAPILRPVTDNKFRKGCVIRLPLNIYYVKMEGDLTLAPSCSSVDGSEIKVTRKTEMGKPVLEFADMISE